jgi:hypothetical protein
MQERLLEVRGKHFTQVMMRLKPLPTGEPSFTVLDSEIMGLAKQLIIDLPG